MSDLFRVYFDPAEIGPDGWRSIGRNLVLKGGSERLSERFDAKVIRDPDPCGCWRWTGSLRPDGYGQLQLIKGITWRAHRVAYFLRHGGLPDGLVLDHLCRNRWCVNPDHLEPVTHEENIRLGVAARLGTVCKRGHPRTEANTYRKGTHHECRICHRERQRSRRARA